MPGDAEDGHGEGRVLHPEGLAEGPLAGGDARRVRVVHGDVADLVEVVPEVGQQEDQDDRREPEGSGEGDGEADPGCCRALGGVSRFSGRAGGVHSGSGVAVDAWRKLHSLLSTKLMGITLAMAMSWLTPGASRSPWRTSVKTARLAR